MTVFASKARPARQAAKATQAALPVASTEGKKALSTTNEAEKAYLAKRANDVTRHFELALGACSNRAVGRPVV
jgi:hypothetical protein